MLTMGPSYLQHANPYIGKTTSLYRDGPLMVNTLHIYAIDTYGPVLQHQGRADDMYLHPGGSNAQWLFPKLVRIRMKFWYGPLGLIHHRQKLWNIWLAQWERLYLIFWFAGNGLAPTTKNYSDMNTTLICSRMDKKCTWFYRNVSFLYFALNFQQLPAFPALHCESMKIYSVYNNSLLVSWDNLSAR